MEVCVRYVVDARVPIKTQLDVESSATVFLLIRVLRVERFLNIEVLC